MKLPITGTEILNDDFRIKTYKKNAAFSEETDCFQAVIEHIPTKKKIYARNDGRGGCNFYDFDDRSIEPAWKQFCKDGIPALRESVADHPEPWARELYQDDEIFELEDSVLGLVLSEIDQQRSFSRKKGLMVIEENQKPGTFMQYRTNDIEVLRRGGRVKGQYWNKDIKDWETI